jgi:CRP/FNR family transcriptional regulator, cyclic AMP receptor protein
MIPPMLWVPSHTDGFVGHKGVVVMNNLPPARIVTFLRNVPLFQGIADDDLLQLAPSCRFRPYKKGSELFRENDEGGQMFLIISGHVLIQRINKQGQTLFIAERGPNDYIGEFALIDGLPRSADAVAYDDCEFLIVQRGTFLEWIKTHPSAMWNLVQNLTARLRETLETFDNSVSKDALGRLCCTLLQLAQTARTRSDGSLLLPRITQEHLAERIYSDRATVNRLLTVLENSHAIRREGRLLIITDIDRIKRLSDR